MERTGTKYGIAVVVAAFVAWYSFIPESAVFFPTMESRIQNATNDSIPHSPAEPSDFFKDTVEPAESPIHMDLPGPLSGPEMMPLFSQVSVGTRLLWRLDRPPQDSLS